MSIATKFRSIGTVIPSNPVREGAGVIVRRTIGTRKVDYFDPFLLLDEFNSENPNEYIAGFPDHPHRGFETVTYMLDGIMEHKDHVGNHGILKPGSVQWMTAGKGIVHSEMPKQHEGKMRGFQMWVNLPAKNKMMPPRYQDIQPELIPVVKLDTGATIKVMAGESFGTKGAVSDIVTNPLYLDITLPPGQTLRHPVNSEHNVWTYVFEGEGMFGTDKEKKKITPGTLVLYEQDGGNSLEVSTENSTSHVRFLLASAQPLNEPMARYGPFVMNTQDEIMKAFQDFQSGKF